jgi:uncharacterized protein YkwD
MNTRPNYRVGISCIGILLLSFILLTSFRSQPVQTNQDPLSGWNMDILKQANTAQSVAYLTDNEKQLIYYTNLCRLKPKLFCQTVLAGYLKTHTDTPEQITSLKKQLNEDNACGAMVPDKELCTIAHDFAKKMGVEGKEGHPDFINRMKPVMKRFNRVGENCDYGNKLALDAFMHLLIDSSDPVNLAHRKNLLDPKFTAIGVALQPHKTYTWNFVMDLAGE